MTATNVKPIPMAPAQLGKVDPHNRRIIYTLGFSGITHLAILALLILVRAFGNFRIVPPRSSLLTVLIEPSADPERVVSGIGPPPRPPSPHQTPIARKPWQPSRHPTHRKTTDDRPRPAAAPSAIPNPNAGSENPLSESGKSGSIGVSVDDLGDGPGGTPEGAGTDDAVPVEQVEHPPAVASTVAPEYSRPMRLRRIEGTVVLRVIVNRLGQVEQDIKVVQSVAGLDQSAIDAVRKWRFKPGLDRNGKPVRVLIEIPVSFRLR